MLERKRKILVLILVLTAVVGILAKPYLFNSKKDLNTTSTLIEAYQKALVDGKPIFLEFYGELCPACVRMEPIVMELEEKYKDKIAFIIVDVNDPESRKLIEEYRVFSIPYFIYIDSNGEIAGYDVGSNSLEYMEEKIQIYLLTD